MVGEFGILNVGPAWSHICVGLTHTGRINRPVACKSIDTVSSKKAEESMETYILMHAKDHAQAYELLMPYTW